MENSILSILQICILIVSAVLHEVAHGFAALYNGDKTALYRGRLSMNPVSHIDLMGTIIIPLLLVLFKSPIGFGWAKPVPYDPRQFTNYTRGIRMVALAGVLANFMLALFFGLILRFFQSDLSSTSVLVISIIILTNISLCVFNLIPVPPLDGSKILFSFLPRKYERYQDILDRHGFFIVMGLLLLFYFFNIDPITRVVLFFFSLITGIQLVV